MAEQPRKEFGKRRPQPPAPRGPPPKRSSHVALLLTGTLAVGGTAYAVMPSETCTPPSPGMAAPAMPQTNAAAGCAPRGSSSGGGGRGGGRSRYGFFGGDSSGHSSSTSSSSESSSTSVTRGGFGALARAFGFSGRG